MKRLIGGLVLLNLCSISLSINGGEQDITNNDVLNQLTELRSFIDEKRDFSKDAKDLKPIVVQYRSSVSKIDGVVQCNMGFNTDALHLSIGGTSIQKDGTPLTITINVVYEFTDYVGYTIKSAKINVVNVLKSTSNLLATITYDTTEQNYVSDKKTDFVNNQIVYLEIENNSTYLFAIGIIKVSNDYTEIKVTPFGIKEVESAPVDCYTLTIDLADGIVDFIPIDASSIDVDTSDLLGIKIYTMLN